MEFTEADVASLGHKLDELDLTTGERAALRALFEAAAGEVEGFALNVAQAGSFGSRLGSILFFDEADALFGKRS